MFDAKEKHVMENKPLTFQDMILTLERYWADHGCTVMQP